MTWQNSKLLTTWSGYKAAHKQVGLLATKPFERSGTDVVYNMVGAARSPKWDAITDQYSMGPARLRTLGHNSQDEKNVLIWEINTSERCFS